MCTVWSDRRQARNDSWSVHRVSSRNTEGSAASVKTSRPQKPAAFSTRWGRLRKGLRTSASSPLRTRNRDMTVITLSRIHDFGSGCEHDCVEIRQSVPWPAFVGYAGHAKQAGRLRDDAECRSRASRLLTRSRLSAASNWFATLLPVRKWIIRSLVSTRTGSSQTLRHSCLFLLVDGDHGVEQ